MPSAVFEPAIPATKQLQTLDHKATGIGYGYLLQMIMMMVCY
jgi:hypothetical protein